MNTMICESLEAAAAEMARNWRRFESFCWHRASELEDADDWCVVYTHHRDSRLLDRSNADAICRAMEAFFDTDDVVAEHHGHWAVGWIDGYSIRVFKDGEITTAFIAYYELAERLESYPILDEEDYSRREYEATLENIADAAWRLRHRYELPEGWEGEVYSWFADHNERAIDNRDDQGGYPQEAELEEAFDDLGFEQLD